LVEAARLRGGFGLAFVSVAVCAVTAGGGGAGRG
jgi:hypothetical protein